MQGLKYRSLYFLALLVLMYSAIGFSQTAKEDGEDVKATETPIVIKSNTMVVNNALKLVTFTGDVKAEKDDFVIDCDKMMAYYESMSDQPAKGEAPPFNKLVALGNVVINRAEGGVATAEKATYHHKDERMVLTGSPTVKQGSDVVKGERITIFLKEDRIKVEQSTVTITPRRE